MREDVELVSPFLVLPRLQRTPRRRSVAEVGGDIVSWFKADQVGAPLQTGQSLGRWPDAIGGDPALPVATAPTWLTGQQNGLPAVLFNDTAMRVDPNAGAPTALTDPWTVAWVAKILVGSIPLWARFSVNTLGGIVRGPLVNPTTTSLVASVYAGGDDGTSRILSASVPVVLPMNAWHAGVVTYDGSARPGVQSLAAWVNGAPQVLTPFDINPPPQPLGKIPLVTRSALGGVLAQAPDVFTQGGNFALGELLVIRRQFAPVEAVQLSASLRARWGTP